MTPINLTPDDIAANRAGILSAPQRRIVEKQRLLWLLGMGVSVLIALSVVAGFAYQQIEPTFANRGQLYVWTAVCLFWLWLFRSTWQQWFRARHDLSEGTVSAIEGHIAHDLHLGVGVVPQLQYGIRIGTHRFAVPKTTFFQFTNGQPYHLVFTPHAKILLGALLLQAATTSAPPVSTTLIPPLAEPLTDREQEILALIADGLSNQEIALHTSLSVNTIKAYTSGLYQKLGVQRRTEAVARARHLGLL